MNDGGASRESVLRTTGDGSSPPALRVLTFSTLYPSAASPNHGVFVENRLRHLLAFAAGRIEATVMAPVPWFPSANPRYGAWARHAATPLSETRHGIVVLHPRFLAVPRFGMNLAPFLLYAAARRALRAGAPFDLIDAHYLYPDGVASVWLGRRLGVPVVLTARGSDVTQLPDHRVPRALILRAIAGAAGLVTVSRGLAEALERRGVAAGRISVLRNGIDLAMFPPQDQAACRAALGVTGLDVPGLDVPSLGVPGMGEPDLGVPGPGGATPVMVSVGALIPRKGHDLTIGALAQLPGWHLLIAGEGPERTALLALAARLGVEGRVHLLGAVPHAQLARIYGAADLSVLSSAREGWANVLLESMACGTPVVASPIPGNDEVVQGADAGVIASARTPHAIAEAVRTLAARLPARAQTCAYAARFGWDETSAGQLALFERVTGRAR